MTEQQKPTAEYSSDELWGEQIERLFAQYYDGVDVTAELQDLYAGLMKLWHARMYADVDVDDGLVDMIRTVELMLQSNDVPIGHFASAVETDPATDA